MTLWRPTALGAHLAGVAPEASARPSPQHSAGYRQGPRAQVQPPNGSWASSWPGGGCTPTLWGPCGGQDTARRQWDPGRPAQPSPGLPASPWRRPVTLSPHVPTGAPSGPSCCPLCRLPRAAWQSSWWPSAWRRGRYVRAVPAGAPRLQRWVPCRAPTILSRAPAPGRVPWSPRWALASRRGHCYSVGPCTLPALRLQLRQRRPGRAEQSPVVGPGGLWSGRGPERCTGVLRGAWGPG